ncbi:solute carrier organic anion transporter family member 1C1 isoform X4 [Peromyscus eremicus]|uniref:solute carrier organic anion transporter family member 1C1 isoform X4 n=1 Tax=Peromyscus eremicus TaxID=42410 RepID=UPI0027DD5C5F|nr:solute carrier organic anion transporter family member 1C1 isoform X4 [Peromyscus eremicus]
MDTSSKKNAHLFHKNPARPVRSQSLKVGCPSPEEARPCCGELKVFLGALSFVYFAKALAEGYLKSTITQIERRFEISSSLVGIIDGSFEIGNLLVITFVSYFGAKLHRPKLIGAGCLVMGMGTMLIAVPQFFMENYEKYEKYSPSSNLTPNISPCHLESSNLSPSSVMGKSQNKINDGCVQTVAIIGPIFGFLLGSLCAKLYVDIGFVNLDHITITPKDPQWVGAWWLGYLIAGLLSLLAAVPFWCLPKTLPRSQSREDSGSSSEKSKFIIDDPINYQMVPGEEMKFMEMARNFLPSLKTLLRNPVYILYLCASTVQFNSLFGMVTYKPKYIEQQYGQSSSKANFVIGLINIPAVALGIFSGGIVMKKFRLGVFEATKLYLGSSVFGYLLFLSLFALGCENPGVAGLTVSYQGTKPVSYHERALFSDCNSRCKCSESKWEPMCGDNGITYVSACLAGCQSSSQSGKSIIFSNCTCVGLAAPKSGNWSGMMGRCQKDNGCPQMFLYFLVISVITSYTLSLGGIPGYILLLRCIQPQLKSFALGIYTLAIRVLAGIPAPVYFGVLIDTSCLKWGFKKCGSRGSCRLYDSHAFRHIYLGLTTLLGTVSIFLSMAVLFVLKKKYVSKPSSFITTRDKTVVSSSFKKEICAARDHVLQPKYWPGKETRL